MITKKPDLEALPEGAQDIYKRGDFVELDIRGETYAFCYAYVGLDRAFQQGVDARLALDDYLAANEAFYTDDALEKGWCKPNPDKETRKIAPRILTDAGGRRLAMDTGITHYARAVLWSGLLTFYPDVSLDAAAHLFAGSEIKLVNGVLNHIQTSATRMLTGVYTDEEAAEGKDSGRGAENGSAKATPSTSPSSQASASLTPENADT